MRLTVTILALVFVSTLAGQSVLQVPGTFTTIQAAIDAAAPGDRIEVAAGTYNELIVIAKGLEVVAPDGAAATIIDGQGMGTVVTISGAVGRLEGFTIRGGLGASLVNQDSAPGGLEIVNGFYDIVDCVIEGNAGGNTPVPINNSKERGGAGGLRLVGGTNRLIGCIIRNNLGGTGANRSDFGLSQDGGAGGLEVFFLGTATAPILEIRDCEFRGNVGGRGGDRALGTSVFTLGTGGAGGPGAILARADVIVDRTRFIENVGASGGVSDSFGLSGQGAVTVGLFVNLFDQGGSLTATSSLFLRNQIDPAAVLAGAGASVIEGEHRLDNCTVFDNTGGAAAILGRMMPPAIPIAANQHSVLRSCIVRGNTPDNLGSALGSLFNDLPDVAHSNIEGGAPGINVIDVDPLFLAPTSDDYRLSQGSPCIDAGDPAANVVGLLDLEGEGRLFGGRVDMGIDESRPSYASFGNIGGAGGPGATPGLFFNGSSATLQRLAPNTAYSVSLTAPSNAPFFLFARGGTLGPDDVVFLPFGIEAMIFDPLGTEAVLVTSSFPGTAGFLPGTITPWTTTNPAGLPAGVVLNLQAIVLDGPGGLRASNGITVGFDS